MKTNSLKFNIVMNVLLTLSSFLFPMLTFPYVSRILGPEGIGKVSFAQSIITYFTLFAQLGIPSYGIRICAQNRDDQEELSRIVQELTIISLVMTAIVYGALLVSVEMIDRFRNEKLLILISSASILFGSLGMEWMYKGLEQYAYITTRSLIFKVISVCLMFALIHAKEDYIIYGTISVFASSASQLLNLIHARKYIRLKPCGGYHFARHWKAVGVFLAMSCATTIYTNLDTVMLGFMTTDADVGYYNAAVKMKIILVAMVTSLGTVLLPRASYYVKNHQSEEFCKVLTKSFRFVAMVSLPAAVYFILFAKQGILFLSGEDYLAATAPMQLIMPTIALIGFSNVTGMQILVPLGGEKYVLYSEIAGAAVDIVINALLIPTMAASGAAIGTTVAEIVVLCVQCFFIRKHYKRYCGLLKDVHLKNIVLATLLGIFVSGWCIRLQLGAFGILSLSAMCFFAGYVGCLLLLKDDFMFEMLEILRDKMEKYGIGTMKIWAIREKLISKKEFVDKLFLFSWAIYFCFVFLENTMIYYNWFVPVYRIASLVLLLIMLYRFATIGKRERAALLLMLFVLFAGAGMLVFRHTKAYLLWAAAIIAAKDVEFEKIVKVALGVGTALMLIALIGSQLGFVPDLVYNSRGGRQAHALGICYTTDCAAHVFYLMLGYLFLKRSNIKAWVYPCCLVLAFAVYLATRARNNTICMCLLLAGAALYRPLEKWIASDKRKTCLVGICLGLFFVFCICFSLYHSFCFNENNEWLVKFNAVLGGRYTMGKVAFDNYGITLWGSNVPQQGFGGGGEADNYFFLDISYVNILLCAGAVVFCVSILLLLKILYKGFKTDLFIMGIIAVIALQSCIEHHMIQLQYNYFLLLAFAAFRRSVPRSSFEAIRPGKLI